MFNSTASGEGYSSPILQVDTDTAEPVVYSTDFEPVPKKEPLNLSYENLPELDSMVSPIPFTMPFKLRDPVVVLERCDKIWETLKFIRNVQSNSIVTKNENPETVMRGMSRRSWISVDQLKFDKSYVQYHPVLGNGNDALPDFEFSVKSKQKLFQCSTCGKEYMCKKNMKIHATKLHGSLFSNKESSNTRHSAPAKSTGNRIIQSDTSESEQGQRSPVQQQGTEAPKDHVRCLLCQHYVRDIRYHLIDYHKIVYPDIMLKEFEVPLFENNTNKAVVNQKWPPGKLIGEAVETTKERTQGTLTLPGAKNEESKSAHIQKKRRLRTPYVGSPKKRRTDNKIPVENAASRARMSNSNLIPSRIKGMIECDICLSLHSSISNLYEHRRRHKLCGETKENYLTYSRESSNSRTKKQITVSGDGRPITSSTPTRRNGSADNNDAVSIRRSTDSNESKLTGVSNNNENETTKNQVEMPLRTENIRSQVTSSHRTSVTARHTFPPSEGKFSPETETSHAMRNSSDRDSGIGISITIKKKNNSYEIVSKESSDDKSKDSCHSKESDEASDISDSISDNNIPVLTVQELQALESSKYSKDHSILKIKCIDEDVIVDIDEDSQSVNNETGNTAQSDKAIKDRFPTLKDLCRNVMIAYQLENCKALKYPAVRKICLCGQRCKNTINYLEHGRKSHAWKFPLPCGYCRRLFETSAALSLHVCVNRPGEKYVEKALEISCPVCNKKLGNCTEFEKHIQQRHFDSRKPYHCYRCCKRFTYDNERQKHFSLAHYETCRYCFIKIPVFLILRHENYHRGFGHPCHSCQRAYSTKKELAVHKDTFHLDIYNKRVKCVICPETFSLKYFRDHMHMHANNMNCDICNEMVPIKNMRNHIVRCLRTSNRRRSMHKDLETL